MANMTETYSITNKLHYTIVFLDAGIYEGFIDYTSAPFKDFITLTILNDKSVDIIADIPLLFDNLNIFDEGQCNVQFQLFGTYEYELPVYDKDGNVTYVHTLLNAQNLKVKQISNSKVELVINSDYEINDIIVNALKTEFNSYVYNNGSFYLILNAKKTNTSSTTVGIVNNISLLLKLESEYDQRVNTSCEIYKALSAVTSLDINYYIKYDPPVITDTRLALTPQTSVGSSIIDVNNNYNYNQLTSGSKYDIETYFNINDSKYVHDAVGNIDYSNLSNFSFFGSAESRIKIFMNKIISLEYLSSIPTSSVNYSASLDEISSLKSKFDAYERYLYFEIDEQVNNEYTIQPYPKDGSTLLPLLSTNIIVKNWLSGSLNVAINYDNDNMNRLIYGIPTQIYDDSNNISLVKLIDMCGHYYDHMYNTVKYFDLYNFDNRLNSGNDPNNINLLLYNFGFNPTPKIDSNDTTLYDSIKEQQIETVLNTLG